MGSLWFPQLLRKQSWLQKTLVVPSFKQTGHFKEEVVSFPQFEAAQIADISIISCCLEAIILWNQIFQDDPYTSRAKLHHTIDLYIAH